MFLKCKNMYENSEWNQTIYILYVIFSKYFPEIHFIQSCPYYVEFLWAKMHFKKSLPDFICLFLFSINENYKNCSSQIIPWIETSSSAVKNVFLSICDFFSMFTCDKLSEGMVKNIFLSVFDKIRPFVLLSQFVRYF